MLMLDVADINPFTVDEAGTGDETTAQNIVSKFLSSDESLDSPHKPRRVHRVSMPKNGYTLNRPILKDPIWSFLLFD